ncbi:MAG: amidohydrolase, partial [Chlorobiales bacterium]|nr:amidohydrolase [Chlorobiales bacterium]
MSKEILLIKNAVIPDETFNISGFSGMLLSNGRIEKLLTDQETAHFEKSYPAFDAKRHLVLPAFYDSHTHLLEFGLRLSRIDLTDKTLPEALQLIQAKVKETPSGHWVLGGGWSRHHFGCLPTAELLDRISTGHFIALQSKDVHAVWANRAALNLLNRENYTKQEIPYDETSDTPQGLALERAGFKLMTLPQLSNPDYINALLRAQAEFFRLGIVETDTMEEFASAKRYTLMGNQLKLRVNLSVYIESFKEALTHFSQVSHPRLRLKAAKLFLDGSLGSETCSMLAPFDDTNDAGIALYPNETIARIFQEVQQQGYALHVHAIGDRAVRRALDGFAELQEMNTNCPKTPLRHRIEHAQTIHPDDLQRFAELGVIASMQPAHIREDSSISARILGKRQNRMYRFRSLLESGAKLVFGSDAPVETPNVLEGLYYAIERRDKDGNFWYPEERISLAEALYAYTAA